MAKRKAILVTEENKKRLIAQFDLDGDDYLDGLVGYYLIAPFGENAKPEGYLTKDRVDTFYIKTEAQLANDWFELEENW